MKDNEKAFYLFYDWIDDLDQLDGADAWKVVKAISDYHRHGSNPIDNVDGTLRVVVSIMFHQIKRGEEISELRRRAGQQGGFATAKNSKAQQEETEPQQKSATEYGIQNTDNGKQNTDNYLHSSLYEGESINARTRARTPSPDKKAYGEFKNVYLTEAEHEDLKKQFGDKADTLIENFSAKLKSKGYKYDDHYVTIRLWAIQDANERTSERADAERERGEYYEKWFMDKLDKTFNTQTEKEI